MFNANAWLEQQRRLEAMKKLAEPVSYNADK